MSSKKVTVFTPPQMTDLAREYDARFRIMFDTAAVGIGMLNLERILVEANPALCAMLGGDRQDLIGKSAADFTFHEDSAASAGQFEDLRSGNADYFQGERRYIRTNGEIFWAQVTMSIVRGRDGSPLYVVGMLYDIDEQKKILVELQKSEARFRTIYDNTTLGIALIHLDGHPLTVNPALLSMTGYSEAELMGRSGLELAHPEDRPALADQLLDLAAGKVTTVGREARFIRKNGQVFWVNLRASVVQDQAGVPGYIVVMVEDIDEQKRVTAELSASEQHFRAVFENSAIGISLIGVDRKPLAVNKALLALTGYEPEEMLQLTGPDISHPDDKHIGDQEFWDVVNGKQSSYQIEKRYQRKDGSIYWVRLSVSGVRTEHGELQYLICMTEDITSRKLAQERLRESEDRIRAIFDNTSVGIALTGLDRKIIQVNEAAARITGYSLDELMNIHPAELSIPQDRFIGQEQLQEMIAGKREGMIVERRFLRKDGRIFWGRVTYSMVRDVNGTPLYLIGLIEDVNEEKLAAAKLAEQDLTYRRSLEQRVEERTRALSEANLRLVQEIEQRQLAEQALARKAAEEAILSERTRLAHDLHDAVTQTLFSASLIAEVLPELWELDPDEARKSSDELRQLTRGALAEMRTLLLELRPAALTQARFPDLIKQLSEAAIGRARLPVNLTVSGENELPIDVKVAFYRIAQESLNNIVKYSRAKQVEITILLGEQRAHLEIKDNGIGFDSANIKPTSLGMRIMRERAESIRASLDISSSPGRGTFVQVDWDGNQ
jgi:PAS domain S-box-containing protein